MVARDFERARAHRAGGLAVAARGGGRGERAHAHPRGVHGPERAGPAPRGRVARARHLAGDLLLRVRRAAQRSVHVSVLQSPAGPWAFGRPPTTAAHRLEETMPAAATLRLSDGPGIGVDTVSSASSRQSAETPWRSLPTTRASGRRRSVSQTRARCPGSPPPPSCLALQPCEGVLAGALDVGTWNSVPTEPRTASGWKTSVRVSHATSAVAPDEHAARTIAPRCPGARLLARRGSAGRTSRETSTPSTSSTTATRPSGRAAVAIEWNASRRPRAPGRHGARRRDERGQSRRGRARGRRPHGSLPGPRARGGAGGGPRRGRHPGRAGVRGGARP